LGAEAPIAEQYTDEFPVRRNCVFLNHAAVAPLPRRTARRIQQLSEEMAQWGAAHWSRWAHGLETVRARAAALLHCPSEDIALVKNTSHGLLIAAQSIPWRDGDNVVAPGHEFPANIYPWMMLRDRGVSLRLVGASDTGPVTADSLLEACDEHTRAVTVSWVQFSTGYRVDLAGLAEACRRRGIYLVVDAIQGLGAVPWPLTEGLADFVAADGHKWMLGVEGCGVLYVNPAILGDLAPANLGWQSMADPEDYLRYSWRPLPSARRFEEGSCNMLGAHALAESLGLLLEVGIPQVWEAIQSLTERLEEGMAGPGCRLRGGRRPEERSGICCFDLPALAPEEAAARLAERRIFVSARAGGLRLSPHFYNTADEIDLFVEALGELLRGG